MSEHLTVVADNPELPRDIAPYRRVPDPDSDELWPTFLGVAQLEWDLRRAEARSRFHVVEETER